MHFSFWKVPVLQLVQNTQKHKHKTRHQFAPVYPWLLCRLTTKVHEKEPSGIRAALTGQQQPYMSHNTPSRHKRESNPVVFIRWYQKAFKRAFITLFSSLNSKKGGGTFYPAKWCNEGHFSFEWDQSHLTMALSGVMPLFRGHKRQKKKYSRIHKDALRRSCCPLLARLSLLWP